MSVSVKKLVLVAIAIIAIIAIGAALYFLNKDEMNNDLPLVTGDSSAVTTDESPNLSFKLNGLYVGDDFTIMSPSGWIQTHIPMTLVSFQNPEEKHPEGSAASKINFKSYVAISSETTEMTLDETAELVMRQIQNVAPAVSFGPVSDQVIDGQPAKAIEASLVQQDVDFKVLVAIVMKGNKYFIISGNTTTQKWADYNKLFYDVVFSFKFKVY
ncbi:MAG: hypothetical protein WC519_03170 [Parcubacteria group bacterium]